jgi:hypothetical protein
MLNGRLRYSLLYILWNSWQACKLDDAHPQRGWLLWLNLPSEHAVELGSWTRNVTPPEPPSRLPSRWDEKLTWMTQGIEIWKNAKTWCKSRKNRDGERFLHRKNRARRMWSAVPNTERQMEEPVRMADGMKHRRTRGVRGHGATQNSEDAYRGGRPGTVIVLEQ